MDVSARAAIQTFHRATIQPTNQPTNRHDNNVIKIFNQYNYLLNNEIWTPLNEHWALVLMVFLL